MRVGLVIGLLSSMLAAGCAEEPPAALKVQVIASGANISGANGIHFSPDGRLFVASVLGSELIVLDPDSGEVLDRFADGVDGPDDVA